MNNLAITYENLDKPSKAIDCYQEALLLAKEMNNAKQLGMTYLHLSGLYMEIYQATQALHYCQKALEVTQTLSDSLMLMNVFQAFSKVYLKSNQIALAEKNIFLALTIAKELNSKSELKKVYKLLKEIYKESHHFEKAFAYQSLEMAYDDSLWNEAKLKNIQKLELQQEELENDLLRKEKQYQASILQNQAKTIRWQTLLATSLGSLFFVTAIFGLVIFRFFQIKKKSNRILQAKNDEIFSQTKSLQHINQQLFEAQKELENFNQTLQGKIDERTQSLAQKNGQLRKHLFTNSHILRRPVANILGLVALFNEKNLADEVNLIVIQNLKVCTQELDEIVHQINNNLNNPQKEDFTNLEQDFDS